MARLPCRGSWCAVYCNTTSRAPHLAEGGVRWPRGPLAPYLQQQNSNLTDADEVAALLEDVSPRPASTEAADGLEWFSSEPRLGYRRFPCESRPALLPARVRRG